MSAASLIALTSVSQSYALSLGEVAVRSTLGQPLDAVVRVTAAPGEILRADCFSVVPPADNGLPAITGVRLSLSTELTPGTLRLRGRHPLREPMSELVLRVDCPGLPQLTRTFVVLVDPPREITNMARAAAAAPEPRAVAQGVPAPAVAPADPRPTLRGDSARVRVQGRLALPGAPVLPGERYVVQRGDALSVIAARVQGRPDYSVWPIAQRIFELNPDAFENADPNTLMVGATLRIPTLAAALAEGATTAPARRIGPAGGHSAARIESLRPAPAPGPAPTRELARGASAPAPRAPAVDDVAQPLPTLLLSRSLSSLSVNRLRLRRSGQIQVGPAVALDAPPAPEVPNVPEEPSPGIAVATGQNVPVLREITVVTKPRFWLWDWLILAAGLLAGAFVMAIGMRRWVRNERAEQERELLRARRHEERLEEARQQRSNEAAPSILVHEGPRPQATQSAEAAPVAIAAGVTALQTEAPEAPIQTRPDTAERAESAESAGSAESTESTESGESAESTGNWAPTVDASAHDELDFEIFQSPDEDALALLEQDYAQSTADVRKAPTVAQDEDDTAMIDPSQLGLHADGTHIMHSSLDLELPQDDGGDGTRIDMPAVTNADPDMTEQGLQFDPDKLELDYDLGDEPARSDAGDTTADEPGGAIDTRSDEDYYHLEASSIRNVGTLSFEEDAEEESKILAFRTPRGKTGTDDDGAR